MELKGSARYDTEVGVRFGQAKFIGTAKKMAPIANKGTAREQAMKLLSENPRFREIGNSGDGFVIVGAKRV